MKNIAYCSIILNLFLFSCQAQKEDLVFKQIKSDLSVKALQAKVFKDSTLIGIFLPQEFAIEKKEFSTIDFSRIRFSLTGANIFGTNNSKIYAVKNDTLVYKPTEVKSHLDEKNKYRLYVSYYFYVNNSEKNNLFEKAQYSQSMYAREIFNLKHSYEYKELLNKKIPDSLKGYIHLNYTNPKTNQFDYLNIPVKF